MAEQFAFEKSLGDRAAIHGDEPPLRPQRKAMDDPGEELLAGPAFAADEHGGCGRRDLPGEPQHLLHGGRPGHEVDQKPLFKVGKLPGPVHAFGKFIEHRLEIGRLKRFDKIKGGAVLQRIGRLLDFMDGGEHHDFGMVPRADVINDIHLERGHPFDVKKNDFHRVSSQGGRAPLPGMRR